MTDLLTPTGRRTVSVIHRDGETHVTPLFIPDGMATKRARALIAWLLGGRS